MEKVALALFLSALNSIAFAVDSVSFEVGHGKAVDLARIGLQWDLKERFFEAGGFSELSNAQFF